MGGIRRRTGACVRCAKGGAMELLFIGTLAGVILVMWAWMSRRRQMRDEVREDYESPLPVPPRYQGPPRKADVAEPPRVEARRSPSPADTEEVGPVVVAERDEPVRPSSPPLQRMPSVMIKRAKPSRPSPGDTQIIAPPSASAPRAVTRVMLGLGVVLVVLVVIGLGAYFTMRGTATGPGTGSPGTASVNMKPFLVGAAYFLIMLLGMAAEYMFGLKNFKRFNVAEFVRPFWVALIVFSVPWSLVDKEAINYASLLACYQNGFFWKKVLESKGT